MIEEKVREFVSQFTAMNFDVERVITKWLEQNPIEPVVVGLSDEQVYTELYQEYQTVKNELEQLKSQFMPDWDGAPDWATDVRIRVHWVDINGKGSACDVIYEEKRPKPTTTVEVGQVWSNKVGGESKVIAVNNKQVVRECISGGFGGFMINSTEDFLAKFERVS